jgi:hypothetical protein
MMRYGGKLNKNEPRLRRMNRVEAKFYVILN